MIDVDVGDGSCELTSGFMFCSRSGQWCQMAGIIAAADRKCQVRRRSEISRPGPRGGGEGGVYRERDFHVAEIEGGVDSI